LKFRRCKRTRDIAKRAVNCKMSYLKKEHKVIKVRIKRVMGAEQKHQLRKRAKKSKKERKSKKQ